MTSAPLITYGIAATFAGVGAVLLLRLRAPLSESAAYAHRIAGVMACVFALMLAGFETVALRVG